MDKVLEYRGRLLGHVKVVSCAVAIVKASSYCNGNGFLSIAWMRAAVCCIAGREFDSLVGNGCIDCCE